MFDYGDEKRRSETRDLELGFRIAETEAEIRARLATDRGEINHQTWAHLSPQIFQTPYAELARVVAEVDPNSNIPRWADLGAAYGRLGIVLSELRPAAEFVGIELVAERVREGRRVYAALGLDPENLHCANLAKCDLPDVDLYFIYDFGTRTETAIVLEGIRRRAARKPIVVVGRGRGIRDAIEREHPWLASITPPVHFPHWSVYRSG